MRGRKHEEVPARLLQLQEKFTSWRKTRSRGERIPTRLWKSAAKLAKEYGLNQTSKVLNLGYYSLKRQVEQQVEKSGSDASFLELPSVSIAPANECVIEFEDGAGASLRMHLKGTDLPDAIALGRSFWRGE